MSVVVIVIACNTATASAIDELRLIFKNIFFVGAEPAINFAYKNGFKNVLSLTTPLTSTLKRYKILSNSLPINISTYANPNLVKIIEDFYFNPSLKNRLNLLKTIALICKKKQNFDSLVLGCTHYVFLKPFLIQFSIKSIIDGNLGISHQLIDKIKHIYLQNSNKTTIKIILSQENKGLIKKYKKILSQTLANYKILC